MFEVQASGGGRGCGRLQHGVEVLQEAAGARHHRAGAIPGTYPVICWRCKLLVVGGCSTAWRCARRLREHDIIVLEPSPVHAL
ncbi:putative sulfide quinone reductase [Operophtera brumata]|uniref:Putative sulfide quinone reductase n=1 Tax=Operophtera brumata TaxID=104452 RepID=A0A0L7L4I6_OPEBR|nr:putative sulfide quinone reductase [Operophtera brumata]